MSDDFDDVLRKFRRDMLGSMVSHMSDEQLDEWAKPFGAIAEEVTERKLGFPPWLQKRFDEERVRLLQVLLSKAGLEARRRNYWI